jgi:hypothetical protein
VTGAPNMIAKNNYLAAELNKNKMADITWKIFRFSLSAVFVKNHCV